MKYLVTGVCGLMGKLLIVLENPNDDVELLRAIRAQFGLGAKAVEIKVAEDDST